MISVICMSQRLRSFHPRLSLKSSRNATPRYSRRNCQREFEIVIVSLRAMAKLGRPDVTGENKRGRSWIDLLATAKYVSSSTRLTCCRRPAWPVATCLAQRVPSGVRDYFGERVFAWVLMSRLCLSTTRRSSRSMVLNASWITFLSGS